MVPLRDAAATKHEEKGFLPDIYEGKKMKFGRAPLAADDDDHVL